MESKVAGSALSLSGRRGKPAAAPQLQRTNSRRFTMISGLKPHGRFDLSQIFTAGEHLEQFEGHIQG